MLTVTDEAANVIRQLSKQPELPPTCGLRIGPSRDAVDGHALSAELASGPDPQDEVLEVNRVRIFLEPQAARRLADKILDVKQSTGEEPAFRLRQQWAVPTAQRAS